MLTSDTSIKMSNGTLGSEAVLMQQVVQLDLNGEATDEHSLIDENDNLSQTSSDVLLGVATSSGASPDVGVIYSPKEGNDMGPLEGRISQDELASLLKNQLEYYFSRENLAMDSYLVSQMDSDQYVPIATVAGFNQIMRLTSNIGLVVAALRSSSQVQVDPTGTRVRPLHKRCIVILREISNSTPIEEIQGLFDSPLCPRYVSCEFAHNNSWYITFDNDQDAQGAYQYLREQVQTFQGKPIMARIKAKPIVRSSFMPKNGYKGSTSVPGSTAPTYTVLSSPAMTNYLQPVQAVQPAPAAQPQLTLAPAASVQIMTSAAAQRPQPPQPPTYQPIAAHQYFPHSNFPFFPPNTVMTWPPQVPFFDPGTNVLQAFAANGYTHSGTFKPASGSRQNYHQSRGGRHSKPHVRSGQHNAHVAHTAPRTSPRTDSSQQMQQHTARNVALSTTSHTTHNHFPEKLESSQPVRRSVGTTYRGSRRRPSPRENEDVSGYRQPNVQRNIPSIVPGAASGSGAHPKFELESTSFPPLPGQVESSACGDVAEGSKLSDVVKGTAKVCKADEATKPGVSTSEATNKTYSTAGKASEEVNARVPSTLKLQDATKATPAGLHTQKDAGSADDQDTIGQAKDSNNLAVDKSISDSTTVPTNVIADQSAKPTVSSIASTDKNDPVSTSNLAKKPSIGTKTDLSSLSVNGSAEVSSNAAVALNSSVAVASTKDSKHLSSNPGSALPANVRKENTEATAKAVDQSKKESTSTRLSYAQMAQRTKEKQVDDESQTCRVKPQPENCNKTFSQPESSRANNHEIAIKSTQDCIK